MLQYFLYNRGNFGFLDVVFLVLTYAILVLVVLPFHEFAHAYVAHLCGDDTAKWNGRLTLNPFAHLTLYGTVMLVLCGFGTARPVPVNPMNFRNRKRDSILVSLAGPLSNLLMAVLAVGIFCVVVSVTDSVVAYTIAYMTCLQILLPINVTLAVFNLLPIPPLDGSRLWSTFLPIRWRVMMEQYSNYCIIALFVLLMTGVLDGPLNALTNLVANGIFALFGLV
ncbi:MAG: site-2 protease family protein [Clostridia bacterium]|nr:site-2 protease family protein [Clostridia bacterium]